VNVQQTNYGKASESLFQLVCDLTTKRRKVDLLGGDFRRSSVLANCAGCHDGTTGKREEDVDLLVEVDVALLSLIGLISNGFKFWNLKTENRAFTLFLN
jgi:hypothetical protein